MWIWCLAIISALLVFALVIAVTGFIPGLNDPDAVLMTMGLCLLVVMAGLPLTFISGFTYDIVMKPAGEN
jgi:membrane-bound acyltransferase YfiQ involved in biofilm formation